MNTGAGYDNDENSQAEGISEGIMGAQQQQQQPHQSNSSNNNSVSHQYGNGNNLNNNSSSVHYENLYEPLEPYADAVAPANNLNPNMNNNNNNNNCNLNNAAAPPRNGGQIYHPLAYRNEAYDRIPAYDVPRGRRNVMERPRYINRQRRQRSFDDTESQQYVNYADYVKYENMYERVREEPEYQNTRGPYGRLDVIGHGVGRIERHLSSSCGNIDHYSLGGHYAVLGHSHLGTVGHIHLNQQQNSKDSSVKSFFSCLGGENSQSMTNIDRAGNGNSGDPSTSSSMGPPPPQPPPSSRQNTGAVPKLNKNQSTNNANNTNHNGGSNGAGCNSKQKSGEHNLGTLNRISKSSLQWLLVNKWLPLWAGESPDYKVVDFNFMFSRKCDGCDPIRFSDRPPIVGDYIPPPREYPTMNGGHYRVIRPSPQQLSRLNENHETEHQDDTLYDRPRNGHRLYNVVDNYQDPFRNWAFNFDNNTFRPAGAKQSNFQQQQHQNQLNAQPLPPQQEVRRITDGTLQTVGRAGVLNLPATASSNHQDLQNPSTLPAANRNETMSPPPPISSVVSCDSAQMSNTRRGSALKDDELVLDSSNLISTVPTAQAAAVAGPSNSVDISNGSIVSNIEGGNSVSCSDDTSQAGTDDNDE